MDEPEGFLRYASPNELRTISREDVGFYHAVIVGAIYDFDSEGDPLSSSFYFHPLRVCIEEQPFLCVAVSDMHTDKAFYQRVPRINLEEHVLIDTDNGSATVKGHGTDDLRAMQRALEANLDRPFPRGVPPWRIVVTPLPSSPSRCFIAFCYSHTVGDGPTGLSFHRTFLRAFHTTFRDKPLSNAVETPQTPFPIPFDTPERLPISWSFLLSPLLSLVFPRFLTQWLGLRSGASTVDAGTWTASPIHFNPHKSRTRIALFEIEAAVLEKALRAARKHDAKLTAVLGQLVARALSRVIPDKGVTNFVSQTPVNMRGAVGLPEDQTGQFVSASYVRHERALCGRSSEDSSNGRGSGVLSEQEWTAAAAATREFATCAATLQDQPIGLLRYLPSVRKWTLGKMGEPRDSSFEVSNVGVFDEAPALAGDDDRRGALGIRRMVFAQPGQVAGPPIAFSVVSLKGGSLVCTATWRAGALGVSDDEEESLVDRLCALVKADFEALE
ncbi:hypothetical protein SODALDRAFT_303010 [Sodiomyces alkalinus F11]|uniref:Alcohol acetyltransferase n=1 Tax=Sodiomyces alkalinus (strain CBS 110278 / VKM F-3762 / F11) TaxID=1314773 RepID=A0A3N2Q5P1_SODAK|nr:hypothetical protein SODALDRAFT_303010 [Sodiomyces alkalinus F11]ROT42017.1 hypothetical protein SODALDRAFT_303010 [Sodiomyces alkalinus F11]